MKNIYDIDNTLLVQRYMKRFFMFCLIHQPKLVKYVVPHIVARIAYALHKTSKVSYSKKYWSFVKDIEMNDCMEAFQKQKGIKNTELIDHNGVYIAYAPTAFIKWFYPDIEVYCLEDMSDGKDSLVKLMHQKNIKKYAVVEIPDKSLRNGAQQIYYIQKGKLIEKNIKTTTLRCIQLLGVLALLSLLITAFVLALTPREWILALRLLIDPLVVLVNFIPVFFLMIIVYGIVNSVRGSFIINSLIFIILVEINRFKIAFRDDPFVFQDIEYASEAAQMTSNYTLFIDKMTALILLAFLFAALYLGFFSLRKCGNGKLRLLLIILPIVSFPFVYNTVYLNTAIYDTLWDGVFGNQWKEANQYIARGFNYSFIRSFDAAKVSPPEGYDEQTAMDTLQTYEAVDMEESQKVNFISIMLEAYNDVTVISPSAEVDPSVYENMHEISNSSYSGSLYTDIFAGGTISSERAFLTGYSSLGQFRKLTNSYVDYFNNQGYYTEAMHPCYGWFYNRKNINDIGFGFNNFDNYESKYEAMIYNGEVDDTFAGFLTDNDFFNEIILGYEKSKEQDLPYFNYSVTYQNHGPYSEYAQGDEEHLKWNDSYDLSTYNIVNNYLANIKATDEAIGNLYAYINAQSEPIVLMMYGDHNPYLGDKNAGFDMLDISLDLGTIEGGQNYYQTPYVITANQAAKDALDSDFQGIGDTISPMFLMNEVFEAANLNIGSSYSQYLKELKQKIDVINPNYIKKDDVYISRTSYQDDGTLEEFYNLQFFEQYTRHNLK